MPPPTEPAAGPPGGDPAQLAAVIQHQRQEQQRLEQTVQQQQENQQKNERLHYLYALGNLTPTQMSSVCKVTNYTIDQIIQFSDQDFLDLLGRIRDAQTQPSMESYANNITTKLSSIDASIATSMLALRDSLLTKDLKDQIPTYDPIIDNQQKYVTWIRALRRQRRLKSLSDSTMRDLVTSSARGAVLDFLSRTLDEQKNISWLQLEKLLTKHFSTESFSVMGRQLMQNMKQKPGEPIAAFAERVLTLSEEAFPQDELSSQTCKRFIIDAFLGGINDGPLLRSLLKAVNSYPNKYSSLKDLIPLAVEHSGITRAYNEIWHGKEKPSYTPDYISGRVEEDMDISNIRNHPEPNSDDQKLPDYDHEAHAQMLVHLCHRMDNVDIQQQETQQMLENYHQSTQPDEEEYDEEYDEQYSDEDEEEYEDEYYEEDDYDQENDPALNALLSDRQYRKRPFHSKTRNSKPYESKYVKGDAYPKQLQSFHKKPYLGRSRSMSPAQRPNQRGKRSFSSGRPQEYTPGGTFLGSNMRRSRPLIWKNGVPVCSRCKKLGHLRKDCRIPIANATQTTPKRYSKTNHRTPNDRKPPSKEF